MPTITEWTFVADIASRIDEILRDRPELPFSTARIEERGRGSRKRRDLTLYDRNGATSVTGEVKLPDNPEGRSPFHEALVIDAHGKADQAGVEYFFTWNVNRLILCETFKRGTTITDRHIETFDALPAAVRNSEEINDQRIESPHKDS